MVDAQDRHVLASGPESVEGELDALHRGPRVLVMAVDHNNPPGALPVKVDKNVPNQRGKRAGADVDRSRKSATAAGARLRSVAVRDGGQDKPADLSRHPFADRGGQHHVDVHGHVAAMLFGRAQGKEDRRARRDAAFSLRPGQFRIGDGFGHGLPHGIAAPPFGPRHCPVNSEADGPARNTIAAATSSGRPMRPRGCAVSSRCCSGVALSKASSGVSVGPGATALTRMSGANSRAQDRVSPRIAALVAT